MKRNSGANNVGVVECMAFRRSMRGQCPETPYGLGVLCVRLCAKKTADTLRRLQRALKIAEGRRDTPLGLQAIPQSPTAFSGPS